MAWTALEQRLQCWRRQKYKRRLGAMTKKVLGIDQLERLMWGAFWDLVDRDKDFRDFAMPSEIICAMAERVHEYLPEVEDEQEERCQ